MYLVINLGLKSIRGIVFDVNANQLFSSSREVSTMLYNQRVEQDANEWKIKLDSILYEISNIDSLKKKIKFITSTTSSSCVYGVDNFGTPLTEVIMVSDKRAILESEEIGSMIKKENPNSLLSCPASSMIPKALWYKRNNLEVFDNIKYWFGAGEFINHYFTSKFFTDPLNASKSLYENKGYLKNIINKVGIDINTLVEVEDIGYDVSVSNNLIKEYNFNQNCKYILTTYDAICAVIGSNDVDKNTACDVSGTVTSLRILSDKGLSKTKGTIFSQELLGFNKHLIGSSNNLGGGIIEWLKQAFYNQNFKNVYSTMETNAMKSLVGAHGVVFLPYLLGERSPFKNHNSRGVFFGMDRSTSINEFSRAAFESTAYVTRDLLDLIVLNGVEVDSINVSGGLARIDLINQIKADVTNKRVKQIQNFESTAVGSLILLLISIGEYKSISEASSNIIKVKKIYNPSKEKYKVYNEFFDFYKELNKVMYPMYEKHLKLKSKTESYMFKNLRNL